jgi:hypothetical protein
MEQDQYIEEVPVEVLETYNIIEKLLHPGDRIYAVNPQVSKVIEMLLNDLYHHNGNRNSL